MHFIKGVFSVHTVRPAKWLLLLILLLTFFKTAQAQTVSCAPPNIGFEDGTFTNWQCYIGKIEKSGDINVDLSIPVPNRHTMISKGDPSVDPYGNFPVLCPNGSGHSIRLGNADTGAQAERVAYTFKIPVGASKYNLIFNYAVVLQNPTHAPQQQPRFTVKIYNLTDNDYIDCSSFNFIASSDLPGFKLSKNESRTSIYYKDWSSATINLEGDAGKTIRLEFTTNDCSVGGHFGYAYLDVNEDCTAPITGNSYCTGQTGIKLAGPSGFATYTWYNADFSQLLGTGQFLHVTPAPPDQTKYALTLQPLNGLGCIDTVYTVVNKIDAGFVFQVDDTVYACSKTPADLTAAYITAGSSSNLIYSYYNDADGLQFLYNPNAITAGGTYYINALNPSGCTNTLPVKVVFIDDETLKVTNPPEVIYPATADITTSFIHNSKFTYSYYVRSDATDPVADPAHVIKSGTYYIKSTSTTVDCSTITPVQVTIDPPPPPQINIFNTFTPNNDGVNDHFFVTIEGYATFGSLKVFNRNGQLIFETMSIDNYWDGTFNGRPANSGTYYYIFEGINSYYQSKIVQSGYIALIR